MAKQTQPDTRGLVKKETALLFAVLTLAVGFFGGVMFGIYRSAPAFSGRSMPPAAAPPGQASADLSDKIAALEKEAAANPTNAAAWRVLGNNYFDSDQFEKAIEAYRKSLELEPNNADVWTDLGVMYRRSGKPEEAIKAFDTATSVDPTHEVSRYNKGVVLLHDLNDAEGAIRAWEGLIEVNPLAMSPTGSSVDQMVQQMKQQPAPPPAKGQ